MNENEKIELILTLVSAVTEATKREGQSVTYNRGETRAIQALALEFVGRKLTPEELEKIG